MTPLSMSRLARVHQRTLHAAARLVPRAARAEWVRSWDAELWYIHHGRGGRRPLSALRGADLVLGLALDALWLRRNHLRQIYGGTAALCLVSLACLAMVAVAIGLGATGSAHALRLALAAPLTRALVATPLVLFVTWATGRRPSASPAQRGQALLWMRRQLFLAAKTASALALTFLLSADASLPFHAHFPGTTDVLQVLGFVVLSLVALRWSFEDQDARCKHCLRLLASPERVGRPSHNLLEWSGTEQVCLDGHGLLSVPEMQTSWCASSRWVRGGAGWDEATAG